MFTPRPAHALSVTCAVAAALVVAACAVAPDPTPAPPSAVPTATAAETPRGGRITLVTATGNDVTVEIDDPAGDVVRAESGTPGDGASVGPDELQVVNLEPATLRLTWASGPCDGTATLTVDLGNRQLGIVQPECTGDAVAFDRVLVLHLSRPVDAAEIVGRVQDGVDTAG